MEPSKPRTPRAPRATRQARPAKTVTTPYDPSANLDTEERMAALLEAALEDGHPQVIAAALGAIARAQGMAIGGAKPHPQPTTSPVPASRHPRQRRIRPTATTSPA